MFLFVDLLKPFVLFVEGVKIQTPSTRDIETNFPSIEGFDVSMATSSICSSRIWANISMSFNGGSTSPPHQENKSFTHGCALEHIAILIHHHINS
jgi:hypothetical protein